MKKLVLGVAVAVMSLAIFAQPHQSMSFLGDTVGSLNISNTLGVTNLVGGTITTNVNGVIYTNTSGTQVSTTNGNTTTLVKDLPLWTDRASSTIAASTTLNGNIAVTMLGAAGGNTPVTFHFIPLADGTNESTVAADALVWSVTSAASGTVTAYTNLLATRWPGVKKLRLKSITNATNGVSSAVTIRGLTLNGFIP